MKGWNVFAEIKQYKSMGLNKSQVQRVLNINYKTVNKYWNITANEYSKMLANSKSRHKKIDKYKEEVLEWIKDFKDISSAQIFDWLCEKHGDLNFKERSLRSYISNLRVEYNLPKADISRQFEEIPDLAPGYQAQVDMGQIWLNKSSGERVKVYCFAMVLSHSRYKYLLWSDKPFNTQSFVAAHNNAFEYLGGMPKEIVYDQDRILTVSENNGDIIYTEGFQNYIDIMKYKVRLCRGFDPQSKGKIEAVVKYAKYNFAINRTFIDIDSFNEDSLKWLDRTGNGKKHNITKKIPAEVFTLEKEHLIPVPHFFDKKSSNISLTYGVRKNNIVLYKQNRYQVPKGTYSPGKRVKLILGCAKMDIIDMDTDKIIVSHKISLRKGELVKITHPERDKHNTVDIVFEKAYEALGKTDDAKVMLGKIRKEKPRYCKDQFTLIINTVPYYDAITIEKSVKYCVERSLWSAGMVKETLEYLSLNDNKYVNKDNPIDNLSIPIKYRGLRPEIRSISEYSKALMEDKK